MRIPSAVPMLAAVAALACSDPLTEPDPVTSVRVEGRVLDLAGAPVLDAFAVLHVWLSGKNLDEDWLRTHDGAGPDGAVTLGADGFAGAAVDSIGLEALAPGCHGPRSMKVIRGSDLPDGPQASLTEDLVVDPLAQPVTALGEVCAIGSEPLWGVGSYQLALSIDAIDGEVVEGRWVVHYQRTTIGPDGTFTGVQSDGILALLMTPYDAYPWEDCSELRLAIPVSAAGSWGRAEVMADDGCLPLPEGLTFRTQPEPGSIP